MVEVNIEKQLEDFQQRVDFEGLVDFEDVADVFRILRDCIVILNTKLDNLLSRNESKNKEEK